MGRYPNALKEPAVRWMPAIGALQPVPMQSGSAGDAPKQPIIAGRKPDGIRPFPFCCCGLRAFDKKPDASAQPGVDVRQPLPYRSGAAIGIHSEMPA